MSEALRDRWADGARTAARDERRVPYGWTAAALLGAVVLSQALPLARRSFGGNVPPLFARLEPGMGLPLLAPLGLGVVAWALLPALLRASLPAFLASVVAFGWLFAVALAVQSGSADPLTEPLRRPLDYHANVPLVEELGPRGFVEGYAELSDRLSLHARTHPPGAPLLLWVFSRVAGGQPVPVAGLIVLAGMLGAIPTYFLARAVAAERPSRLAAALFVASPAVVLYSATSVDAVFMTVIAAAAAALVRAPRSDAWAGAAGLLAAVALAFTFGAFALGLLGVGFGLLAVPQVRGRALIRRGAVAAVALGLGALALRVLLGIDLVGSFRAALDAHLGDPSRGRPYAYWAVANLAAFLLAAGIGHSALLVERTRRAWRRRRPGIETVLWASLVLASLTGMFLGEVEHIWLFFVPVLAVSAASSLEQRGPADARVGEARVGEARVGEARVGEARVGEARVGEARVGEARGVVALGLGQAILMEVLLYTFW